MKHLFPHLSALFPVLLLLASSIPQRRFTTNAPYSSPTVGIDNLIHGTPAAPDPHNQDCALDTWCSAEPVCGSDCQIYPSACYLRYEACVQNSTISEIGITECLEQDQLEIVPLPDTVDVLYGDSAQLVCRVRDGHRPRQVLWYKVFEGGKPQLITSQQAVINITNITHDTAPYYFCQVSNCNKQIVQSNTAHVRIPENVCLVYGIGHVSTFHRTSYTYQSECTYVASMDCVKGVWFVYARFESSWQVQPASLSSVTFYYNYVPIELQRGWIVNYFGRKTVIQEDQTMEMFGMVLTFDGLYLKVSTPEVTLHWDGLGSLIIGVKPGTPTCGLCGSNTLGAAHSNTPSWTAASVDLKPRYGAGGTMSVPTFVQSWALDRSKRCKYGAYPVDTASNTAHRHTQCPQLHLHNTNPAINTFYQQSCQKDSGLTDLIVGDVPVYCWSQLALYQLQDYRHNSITTLTPLSQPGVCELSVVRRQYLAYFVGCPNANPPFDI